MANSFFVPFNNEPSSVSVETTSYSPASGKYAYVIPTNLADGFQLDSSYVYNPTVTHYSRSIPSPAETTVFYTAKGNQRVRIWGQWFITGQSGSFEIYVDLLRANATSQVTQLTASSGVVTGTQNEQFNWYSSQNGLINGAATGDEMTYEIFLQEGDQLRFVKTYSAAGTVRLNVGVVEEMTYNGIWINSSNTVEAKSMVVYEYDSLA